MKKLFILCLCIGFLFSSTTSVFAKNFDKPPKSSEQIENGDTYGKGDGEIKIFDQDGKLIVHEKGKKSKDLISSLGQYDNGNYGGQTDIWWFYNIIDPFFGSGPKAEADTWSWAADGTSDYLQANLDLYVHNIKRAYDYAHNHEVGTVHAYCEDLRYGVNPQSCRGTAAHKVIDSTYGWDATFSTSDQF